MADNPTSGLGPLLSPEASIVLPDDADFAKYTDRWRQWHAPDVAAVVRVATEADVQQTVRFAAQHDIPFVARAGGHGATESLGTAKKAIQLDLRSLNQVKVLEGGTTAIIGGGADAKHVVNELEKVGKRAVTGVCENVGISAVILGGGHGYLQGKYGLAADQVISARLVLANGELITVSEISHPDLFWALKGAGHNFGIVTEWEYRVYDAPAHKYSYQTFIYSGDKLEAFFELANRMLQGQPAEVTQWTYLVGIPPIDADHPVIFFCLVYDGPAGAAKEYAAPFHSIGPLSAQAGEATYHELAVLTFQDADGLGCAYGSTSLRFPTVLESYNPSALRKVYDDFDATLRQVPELARTIWLIEGHAVQAVQAVDPNSTAFPHRSENVLISPFINYKPDPALDEVAQALGRRTRQYLLDGSDDPTQLRAYVNYAHGDEPLGAVYGWEDWRLEKLRGLKKKYDPEYRMRYYVPIL
ncbi:FAD-binding domain-containing protein [Parathielavia appendiculata]|uniref:FAD-binding domain-containing protein n=1 Tax=Parathielavia appendiculata TaxID=2587402 RepID=A0AAN6TW06_9PEZI|nr:FAD-binding domain-containing protein [Parathielavia appendiculata]